MAGDELADPAGGRHQFSVGFLGDVLQILVDGAMSVRVHFDAVQIAAYQRNQSGEFLSLETQHQQQKSIKENSKGFATHY